jgi:hypothetical protein
MVMPMIGDEKRNVYEALTRYNYFPNQKSNMGELPPCLSTRQYTPEIVEALSLLGESKQRKNLGYDLVEYKATRYNNVPRVLSLVHPKAYALLAKSIHDNWEHLSSVCINRSSIIKPELHEDGRLMVMNYEDPIQKVIRNHEESFSKRFRVHADIANCFNSIYSHAIPWAAVGITEAKINKEPTVWFNQLDLFQRKSKRGETQGIPIGPATSSIFVELILSKIDSILAEKGFQHHRYVDDYTCCCTTNEDAQHFIQTLSQELFKYKLTLNLNKTSIEELPSPNEDSWVLELLGALPSRLGKSSDEEPKLAASEALTFINRAILINKATPDGSVLKYAIQLVINHLDEGAAYQMLSSVFNLAWHFPVLIPHLDQLFTLSEVSAVLYKDQLIAILKENAEKKRSDGMSWPLHILKKFNLPVDHETANLVIQSEDCVAITILYFSGNHDEAIKAFIGTISITDNYEIDAYWLLFYQMYLNGKIDDPYKDGVFKRLKDYKVNFLPEEGITSAEKECQRIKDEWVKNIFSPITDGTTTEQELF